MILAAAGFIGCGPTEGPPAGAGPGQPHPTTRDGGAAVRLEDVKQIVARQYGVAADRIDVNHPLLEYGDELNVVEVVMELEERYWVKIPDENVMDMSARGSAGVHKDLTTAKLVEIVQRQLPR